MRACALSRRASACSFPFCPPPALPARQRWWWCRRRRCCIAHRCGQGWRVGSHELLLDGIFEAVHSFARTMNAPRIREAAYGTSAAINSTIAAINGTTAAMNSITAAINRGQ